MASFSDERAIWLGRNVLPHETALRTWLRRRRHDGLEIDDIIQETYTRLISAESVAHILDARSYAFQTAGSVVIDHLRRMKVVSISSVPDLDYLEVVSDDPSPERQVIDRDELHRAQPAYIPNGTIGQIYPTAQTGFNGYSVQSPMGRYFTIGLKANL